MVNIDQNRMQQVAQVAFDEVSGNRRWETAIAKAKVQLESNPYMHYDGQSLLILSPSGEIYSANGTCQCKAYMSGQHERAEEEIRQRVNKYIRLI